MSVDPISPAAKDGAPLFAAELSPHRSLSGTGFLVLMAAISLASFVAGLVFYLKGAWPVAGFFGLDVALVYLAFKLNYRAGKAREHVALSVSELLVTRVSASGAVATWSANPYWVQVRLEGDAEEDRTTLTLASHGRRLVIGGFLSNEERHSFAAALKEALIRIRALPAG